MMCGVAVYADHSVKSALIVVQSYFDVRAKITIAASNGAVAKWQTPET